jgi:glycosyltransferase 2 family protein
VKPSSPRTKKQLRSSLLRWLGTGISVLLLVYLLSKQGWAEIWQAVQHIPPLYFGIAILLMLGSRLTVAGRWYALLKGAKQDLSIRDTIRLVFAGLFASNFLPTTIGGDVIRLAGAVRRKLDASIITASLLADRLVGIAGMTTLLPIGLPYLLDVRDAGMVNEPVRLMTVIGFNTKIKGWFYKGREFIQSTLKALMIWIRNPSSLVKALLWTYGHQICLFTTIWVLFQGMDQSISWWVVAGLWIFNYYISLLPISINGLGVQELSIAYIYTQFGGVSTESALAMAVLIRALFVIASLPGVVALPEIMTSSKSQASLQGQW